MKNLFFSISTFTFLLINILSFAQVPLAPPEGINYQAIARDTTGKPISSSINLDVRFTIWPDSAGTGTSLFTETHSLVQTNRYGLFTLIIGSVNTTDFQNIIWPLGDKFLEVEIAIVGGSFTSMGKTQMMSVPYALHSKTSDNSFSNWSFFGNSINTSHFIGTTNSQDLVVKTSGTERMRILSNGKAGIGTTTPSALFSVGTTSQFQVDSTGTIAAAKGITSSGAINFTGLSSNGIVRATGGTGTLSSSGAPIDLTSEVTGTLPVAKGGTGLSSLGNWQTFYSDGLGVLTPFPLGASGTYFQSNGTAMAPTWVSPSSLNQNLTQGTGISAFSYNGSAAATVNIANTGITANTYSSSMTGQAITIPSFTVNAQGQLTGVSSTTVNAETPLTFTNGLTRTSNNVLLGGQLTIPTTITGNAFNTLFDLNSTGNFSINKNGNTSAFFINPLNGTIGIGTASPQVALDNAAGTLYVRDGSNSGLKLTAFSGINYIQSASTGMAGAADLRFSDMNGVNTWMTITSAGKVGIGTITPVSKLDLEGGISVGAAYAGTTPAPANGAIIEGSVGIGTTTPSAKLEVAGQVKITDGTQGAGKMLTSDVAGLASWTTPTTGTVTSVTGSAPIISSGGATPAISITLASTSANGYLSSTDWNTFNNKTSGSGTLNYVTKWTPNGTSLGNSIIFDDGTNVGIGTIAPTGKLDVKNSSGLGGGSAGVFEISNSSNSSAALVGRTNSSASAIFGLTTGLWKAGEFIILNAANIKEAIYATTNGNGNALYATNSGASGNAGKFEMLNSANSSEALQVITNGKSSKGLFVSHTGNTGVNYGAYVSNTANGTTNVAGYFTSTGASSNNYAAIFDQGRVGIGTIAPVARLQVQDGPVLFNGTTGATPIAGAGTRMMWVPAKGAFRAGSVTGTQWDDVNIGTNSIAFGADTKASGTYSTAMGYNNIASGSYSTALGSGSTASGAYATAMGSSTASSTYATALNTGTASASYATAMGSGIASGSFATAMGSSTASGSTSTAMGENTTASGNSATSMGFFTTAASHSSLALGRYNIGGGNVAAWVATDPLFEIGIGVSGFPANAMTVLKNGKVGIGTAVPEAFLHILSPNGSSLSQLQLGNGNQPGREWMFNVDAISALSLQNENAGTPFTAMYVSNIGNVGIGTTTPATNARVAIKDGHLQSQQSALPTIGSVSTYVAGSQTLSNATDVAGNITITTTAAAGSVSFVFYKPYSSAPIVILSATNNASASDNTKIWVTTTTTSFTVNFSDGGGFFPPIAGSHTYSYHVIETF